MQLKHIFYFLRGIDSRVLCSERSARSFLGDSWRLNAKIFVNVSTLTIVKCIFDSLTILIALSHLWLMPQISAIPMHYGMYIKYTFLHQTFFRLFQEEGVWSTLLYPEFPTLPFPNRHTMMTGLFCQVRANISNVCSFLEIQECEW